MKARKHLKTLFKHICFRICDVCGLTNKMILLQLEHVCHQVLRILYLKDIVGEQVLVSVSVYRGAEQTWQYDVHWLTAPQSECVYRAALRT